MKSNPQSASVEERPIVLSDKDVSIEQMDHASGSTISADQMEDDSFQANGQNFQNN